jgi:GNAT superfamily N-acetyltransferase
MTAARIRAAVDGDVTAIRQILAAHDEDEPGVEPDVVGPYLRHLITHHRALVTVEGDEVVAYGAIVDAGVATHLADLFVHPDRLGQGIGRALLVALFGSAPRRTTFASRDPRALPVYVRAGMLPLWINLYLAGDASMLPVVERGLAVDTIDASVMAGLERGWTGADRSRDHAFWAARPDADPFVVTDDRGPVALGHARAMTGSNARSLGRLVIRPDADPVAPVVAALRRAGRDGPVAATIPGPNPALTVLLEHGFRIEDQDQAMGSAANLIDPLHLLPNPAML